MSSILEELKKKRAEEGKSYLDISTKNDYSSVEKADKERQEQLKVLEEAVAKLRTPYIDYKENPNTIQSISLEDESFSRPAGDTIQSNQGNNPSKLGPNLISGLGKAALTIDTTKDTAIAGVANQLANAKALGMEIGSISAEQLYNYAKGKHNITNTVAVTRLERSEAAKSAAPVAIMLDEIKKGTYKGTIEDIEKTLKYGNDVAYTKWYNQKIAPSVNRAQQSQAANTSMYGKTVGGIMNFGANAVSGIGQFAANTVLGGPIYAGAMAGLSRDSSGNVQQIRNEGLDQVAKDIGVDVGLGALFSYLMGEATGAINSAIQNAIPKSVLSKAGIIAKNVVSGAGGAYAAVGTTGTLRNIYNKLQGREVSQEDALKPWWSTDTAIATFMGALFNGISGSRSDLAKAKEIRAVMEKQGELNARLSGLSRDAARQFEAGNQQGVETSYNSGKQAIEEFFNRNNLGKVTNTLKNEYLKQWFEYNYDLGIKYENLTNPSATNTTPRIGPSLPTVARPAQQATVVPPPSTAITPSTTQGTALTKENYYDVLRAVTPLLDEKEVAEETLRLMDNYDLGAFDDRTLDKIQRQAEKNVFDKFAQTEEGKRLIASYKDGELQPIKAEEKDFSGGYTTAEGTPITNGIAKWAKESAMKTDGKPDSYYHGSPFLFEEFKDTYTHNGKSLGDGYYLSKNKDWVKRNYAYSKGDKVYEFVLNVKKPFNEEAWLKDKENIIKEAPQIAETFFPDVSPETFAEDIEYGRHFKDEEPTAYDTVKTITEYAQKNGVDTRKIWDWLGYDGIDIDGEVVIFKSNQAKYLDNPYPTSRPAFVAEPKSKLPTEKLPIDWNNVSKKDFKDYVTQKLSDFSNSIDKIYLSKENKLGQWGVYVKGKEKTRIRGNMPFEDNYETYIPFEKGVSPDDMLETIKAELEQWYPKNENSTHDDLEYELLADKVAFVDTEEGSKAWKEYQEKEKVQNDIRMQILQEMEQKGYVEHRVENGDVKDYLTEKGMQNKAEVDDYQKRFYAALDETQRLRDEYDKLKKAYEEEQKRKFFENSTQGSFSMPKEDQEKMMEALASGVGFRVYMRDAFKDYTQKDLVKLNFSTSAKRGPGVYIKSTKERPDGRFYETFIGQDKYYETHLQDFKDAIDTAKVELDQYYKLGEFANKPEVFEVPEKLPVKVLGSQRKFLKDFEEVGYVDVNGNKIESIEDFVDLCQIFRDPLIETTRVVYLNDDNIVVGETALTSNSLMHVYWGEYSKFFADIEKAAKNFWATKFYMMHNHPTGRVEASSADKKSSQRTLEHFNKPGKVQYLGDIIIDHNKYSAFEPNTTIYGEPKLKLTENIKMKNDTYNEIEQYMSDDGWTKMQILSKNDIASLASMVTNKKDYSSLMLLNYARYPMLLQELPNSFFEKNSSKFLKNYIKDLAKKNGAYFACIATTDSYTLDVIASKNLQLQDAVCYEQHASDDFTVTRTLRYERKLGQEGIFKKAKKSHNVFWTDESPKLDLEEVRKKQLEPEKEAPKKLEPKKKEQPEKPKKKEPIKRLEKKKPEPKPEPDKRLGFDAIDKDKEALEKANDKLRDELAKQKKEYEERLKKKDEALEKFKQTKKEQKEKQKLKLKKREEKKKEEQRFKSATPKGKLRMLSRKIEKQTGYYEISNYPELDKKYEEEFGKTIRQTIQTLKTRDIYPYLPAKFQDIVDTFADETYLKANWKTFDKYVKEALQIDEIKKLIEESDTPVAQKLLGIVREHKTAPITIKTAKEMYEDLQILEDIVELAQERLDYRREPEDWKKTVDKAGEELKEIAKENTPKKFTDTSAKLGKVGDNLQSLGSTFSQFKTRIQELFGGDPENPFMRIWDEFQAGDEKKAMLDVLFSRNFDGLVEGKPGKYKMKGELQKDFSENAKPIDTGIKGTNPKTGKEYSENAMLPKKIIMHIVASSKNDDNLMSFSKILLGTDYKGNPVYSNPGGYIVPDDYYLQRGNINLAYKNGKKYVFTKQDIEHLEKLLTPEEKEFVDAALKVGDITAKYGNEVSQKLIGRDLFTVKNYIRIIRDESEFDPELIDPTKLDNLANATSEKYIGISGLLGRGGSLEGRNHRSTRPIYGESLRQSVTNSFRGAIKYIAYALPLYDTDFLLKARLPDTFEKIETTKEEPKSTKDLTYKKVDELPRNGAERTRYYMDNGDYYTVYRVKEKGETVRDLIIKTGDKGFDDYYNQFVDSLVGKGKPYSKFSSMRAKVVLNANLRVAATQFFSYFQMGQFLDHPASSMLKAVADRGTIAKLAKDFLEKDGKDIKGLKGQELINRFIEYVSYKNSQRGLGMFSDDIRYVETGNSVLGRVNTGRLMSIVDKFTVDRTYKALMYDIMAEGKEFGSKEFMDEFKSRLYAIYQSNPMYGEIYKTPFQNNTGRYSEITRALSQFQTVMFEGFNNGKQAKMAYEYYKKKGDEKNAKKYAKRFRHHIQGLIISGLALVALRDYLDRLAKKENDEDYAKKITMDFISNMLSYTIVGDEIFNALFNHNNYDLTTNELSYFNTALDTFGEMGTLATKPTPPNAIKLIKSLGQTIGLPTGSIENTFGILSNLTSGNAFRAYSVLKDNNKYQKWLKNQDAIGTDFKTFYEISQAVKEKTLTEKYGYVKGSETGTYGSLSYAKGRAIMDVLGIEQGKKMTKEQKQAYSKWYNIFKN